MVLRLSHDLGKPCVLDFLLANIGLGAGNGINNLATRTDDPSLVVSLYSRPNLENSRKKYINCSYGNELMSVGKQSNKINEGRRSI